MRPGDIVLPQNNALHAPAVTVAHAAQPFTSGRHSREPSPAAGPSAPPRTPVRHPSPQPIIQQQQHQPAPRAVTPPPLPILHLPIVDAKLLGEQREAAFASAQDMDILRWAARTLKYVERMHTIDAPVDPQVEQWVDEAIIHIVQVASNPNPEPEALFVRGELLASGAFPEYVSKDLRSAFNDFEQSARRGWAPSWYRIGCDYEMLGDIGRARHAFERGAKAHDVFSRYRLGLAYILEQLQLPRDVPRGVSLVRASADDANEDAPFPAYTYGIMLAGEQYAAEVPPEVLEPGLSQADLAPLAKRYLQRAAYFNMPAAQYKCGLCYEHAMLSFPFDPLLSVQYYSAASQGGDVDADMALSKWFLCGATNCFEKNEHLAWVFAERAARHGLPTAEFALGYYLEVGIGVAPDVEQCKEWYRKAASQGNTDASERLVALEQQEVLSRVEHQQHLNARLYAQHTQAMNQPASRARMDPSGKMIYGYAGQGAAPQHAEMARSQTMHMVNASARAPKPGAGGRAPRPTRRVRDSQGKSYATFSDMGVKTKHERECTIM